MIYLYNHLGIVVKKKDVERDVFTERKENPKDLQDLRHLSKQNGFNILQFLSSLSYIEKIEIVKAGFINVVF